jgi:hypothetical protein
MSEDPNAAIRSGGSADPDQPGPGTGVAGTASKLTGTLQTAANDTIDGLEQLSNHLFDAGEEVLTDALKVLDAAQTGVSNAMTTLTAKITGQDLGELPTIPTAEIAGGLTGTAQEAANKTLNGLQEFVNHAYDVGEEGITDALRIVDAAQTRVSQLMSTLTGLLAGKIGPPKG